MANKTECCICCKEIDVLETYNGEMMCQDCYNAPENEVFE